jgi:RNA polymerase sigma-70 factor, ECF subfamily
LQEPKWLSGSRTIRPTASLNDSAPDQLRVLANHHMRKENPGHTLRATELVHEAYIRLVGSDLSLKDRAHFYALASRVIRHILTNHGKSKRREKRGGGAARISLDEVVLIAAEDQDEVLDLHEALVRLEAFDPRKARVVELVFFGGLEQDLAAEALEISPATLRRELRLAKAWLSSEMYPSAPATE